MQQELTVEEQAIFRSVCDALQQVVAQTLCTACCGFHYFATLSGQAEGLRVNSRQSALL